MLQKFFRLQNFFGRKEGLWGKGYSSAIQSSRETSEGSRRGVSASGVSSRTGVSLRRQSVSTRYAYSAIEKKSRRRRRLFAAVILVMFLIFPLTGFVRAVQHESVRQEEIMRNPLAEVSPEMKMPLHMPEITRRRVKADGIKISSIGNNTEKTVDRQNQQYGLTQDSNLQGVDVLPGLEVLSAQEVQEEKGSEAQDAGDYPVSMSRLVDASGKQSLELDLEKAIEVGGALQIVDSGMRVGLSLDPSLQDKAEALLKQYRVPFGGVVLLKPGSGKLLAIASHSSGKPDNMEFALNASGPAASIFKLVTTSAALENTKINGNTPIHYRGGDYVLNQRNYNPQPKLDTRSMTLASALGKSCNPVFARVALNYLSPELLERYARSFAFGRELNFDVPARKDTYVIPVDDYGVARTAAGFGDVTLNPLHAASLIGSIANKGVMMRPYIIDTLSSEANGTLLYQAQSEPLQKVLAAQTASRLLKMMEETTKTGTGRREFRQFHNGKDFPKVISAKTGTLTGKDPLGVYFWFIAAAPADNPEIVVAALVVDQGKRQINASGLARLMLEEYFRNEKHA